MASPEQLHLSKQLCFPLWAVAKEVTRKYQPLLKPLGLTYTQYIALMALWEHQRLSVQELGARLYLDSGTLSPLVAKLVDKGLVNKEVDQADGRRVCLTLTQHGWELQKACADIPFKLAERVGMDPKKAAQLVSLLNEALCALSQQTETPKAPLKDA